jgi:hypothetical protein
MGFHGWSGAEQNSQVRLATVSVTIASPMTVDGIPQGFFALRLHWAVRTTGTEAAFTMTINDDTGANYYTMDLTGTGGTPQHRAASGSVSQRQPRRLRGCSR